MCWKFKKSKQDGFGRGIELQAKKCYQNNILTKEINRRQVALRQAGYSEAGIGEISAALGLLVKHGVLGLGVTAPLAPPLSAAYFPLPAQDPPAVFGPIGQVGLGELRPPRRCSVPGRRLGV